jgi:hypothetical protein
MLRRRRAYDLREDMIDFLLGVRPSPARLAALRARGIAYNPFIAFVNDSMPREAFLALWAEHRAVLLR